MFLAIVGLIFALAGLTFFAVVNAKHRYEDRQYEGPWRKPSRFRPIARFKSQMRGWGLRSDGFAYVRFLPNPGFRVGRLHWCKEHRKRGW